MAGGAGTGLGRRAAGGRARARAHGRGRGPTAARAAARAGCGPWATPGQAAAWGEALAEAAAGAAAGAGAAGEEGRPGLLLLPRAVGARRVEAGAAAGGGPGGNSAAAGQEEGKPFLEKFGKSKLPGKLLNILLCIALSRVGTYIPIDGVDRAAFQESISQGGLLNYVDTLAGGSISKVGVFSLGIVPAINASILLQILSTIFPSLKKMVKEEGSAGRDKYKQYEKYLAFGFAVVSGLGQAFYLRPYVEDFGVYWILHTTFLLTVGATMISFLAEEIDTYKLGNGTSILIFTNIASSIPLTIGQTVSASSAADSSAAFNLAVFFGSFLLTVIGVVYVQEGERKIPINYARFSTRNQRAAGAGATGNQPFLPFKVNAAGVLPVIFSSSFLSLPAAAARFTDSPVALTAAKVLGPGGSLYLPLSVGLIVYFNYFYTFLQLDPKDLADQLKRQGASIPQIRPGERTANYISETLERMSALGSVFLGGLALSPGLIEALTSLQTFRGFAGTSLLILVGVATDTARRVRAEYTLSAYDVDALYDDMDMRKL